MLRPNRLLGRVVNSPFPRVSKTGFATRTSRPPTSRVSDTSRDVRGAGGRALRGQERGPHYGG
eukprot:2745233-Pyramimonas_sp.AAC.1